MVFTLGSLVSIVSKYYAKEDCSEEEKVAKVSKLLRHVLNLYMISNFKKYTWLINHLSPNFMPLDYKITDMKLISDKIVLNVIETTGRPRKLTLEIKGRDIKLLNSLCSSKVPIISGKPISFPIIKGKAFKNYSKIFEHLVYLHSLMKLFRYIDQLRFSEIIKLVGDEINLRIQHEKIFYRSFDGFFTKKIFKSKFN